jgi:hypothetical protein
MQTLREEAILKLYALTDEEIANVLEYMEEIHAASEKGEPLDDPTVGLFSGPTDLGTRAKEILRNDITERSGWTQKKD